MVDDEEIAFNNLLARLAEDITTTQLRSTKKMLAGHVSKEIVSLISSGHDLMFTLVNLKFASPIKLAFLRKLCNISNGETLVEKIDAFQSSITAKTNPAVADVQYLLTNLKIIGDRQNITLEEYKARVQCVTMKHGSMTQQKDNMLATILESEEEVGRLRKEEEDGKWQMETLEQLQTERENRRRIEVYNLKKTIGEREKVKVKMEKLKSDLMLRGTARVNTFDKAICKRELIKAETQCGALSSKISTQEQRVNTIDGDAKLFTLERSYKREQFRVSELAVSMTTRNLSQLYDQVEELNGNMLNTMDELSMKKAEYLEIEKLARLTKEDIRCTHGARVSAVRKDDEIIGLAVIQELQGKSKVMNYGLLGANSFIIKPMSCKFPVAMEINKDGDIVVADQESNKLFVVTLDGKTKVEVDLDTMSPVDIAINSSGNYVVVGKREIRTYHCDNQHLLKKALPFYIAEEMALPFLVSVTTNKATQEVYILDKSNLTVQVFTEHCEFQRSIDISEYVTSPSRIQCLNEHEFVISDNSEHNIKIFHLLHMFPYVAIGDAGYGYCEYISPSGLACDADGNIVIVDTGNHRIHVISKDGKHISMYGRFGTSAKKLDGPMDVAVHDCGVIVVADTNNRRLSVYF